MNHPSRAELERYFSGGMTPEDCAVTQHLLPDCSVCSEVITSWCASEGSSHDDVGTGTVSAQDEARYEDVVNRVLGGFNRLEAAVATERRDASRLLSRLLRQPFERQLILVRNSHRYQTAALCELLLEASFAQRENDPAASEELARVAVAAASRMDRECYGEVLVHDLQGRSWAYLANARRILGDFMGTEQALEAARSLLSEGSGNPVDEAFCWDVETSLRTTRGDHLEAVRCGSRAIALYRRAGDLQLIGRAMIQQGLVWGYAEDIPREVVVIRTGLRLINPERDSYLALVGWHNLCLALHQAGEDRQALAALSRARPVYLQAGSRAGLLRFQWLEGTIAASLQRDEQAEGCLREAREGFIQLGVALDAAEVSLDLASLLYRQGHTAEVHRLAVEMITVFEASGTRKEALAAFILLRKAAERDRVTEALIRRIGTSLDRVRSRG